MFRRRIYAYFVSQHRFYYTVNSSKAPPKDPHQIAKQISSRIKATGPITVAEYMKQVLVNPYGGYYMHRDVFGEAGDFVTSPELNQMFGEMIGVWLLNQWSRIGSPKPLQIVELGPGRGSLSQDLLRVFAHFNALSNSSLSLVEISPVLSGIQARRLCIQSEAMSDPKSTFYRQGITHEGVPVKWYRQLEDVPQCFSLFVAHELFDALPIHKFQRVKDKYREILIDIDQREEFKFRYIIAREETPASKIFIKQAELRPHLEISPESLILAKQIAKRVEYNGGLALIADYGHNGCGTDTFRAFRRHNLHDPLIEPGSADLTADVDFKELCNAAKKEEVVTLGPVSQRDFLMKIGIADRFKKLKESANESQFKGLDYAYRIMTDKEEMGERFKLIAFLPSVLRDFVKKFPVDGFH